MIDIKQEITGCAVDKPEERPEFPDDDPMLKRIDRRPDGELDATCEKLTYWTQEGRKTIYFVISYVLVTGRIDGKAFDIERPLEFFLPAGQTSEDHQWISATMRSLSLAARGAYAAKALQDLRNVFWTKGPVRCGTMDYGNGKMAPIRHGSEVAAVAWGIQQALHRRGYLDAMGNQAPLHMLSKRAAQSSAARREQANNPGPIMMKGKICAQCGGSNIQRLDGCDTCLDCGDSKCG